MSSIIQAVSFTEEDAKTLLEKISEHLGIHKLSVQLMDGEKIEGIVSEVGRDYISLIEGDFDTIVPLSSIKFFRYAR